MRLKKQINRQVISPIIYTLGIEQYFANLSKNNMIIINYHGVTDKFDLKINHRHLKNTQFEADILYYKKNYNVVTLETIFKMYRNNEKPLKKTIALTFDDGYEDNYTIALPILEKYQIPATFFVITAGLENEDFMTWYDLLDMIRLSDNKAYNFVDISNKIKNMGSEREDFLQDLISKTSSFAKIKSENKPYWKLMNTTQLLEFTNSKLIDIGSHTHLHYNLGNIDKNLTVQELEISKKKLENIIQKQVKSIAYPDGNYTAFVKNEAEKAGYKNQLAVNYSDKTDENDTRILPRWSISNSTTHQANMIILATSFSKQGF